MAALRRINHQPHQRVDRNQHAQRLAQINGPVTGGEELREGKNKNREVEQESRIGQIGDYLSRHSGAVGIIICQQPKAGIQTPALFAGLHQSDVESRQPMAKAS